MKIGDRVRVKDDWSYRGTIVEVDGSEAGSAYRIMWDGLTPKSLDHLSPGWLAPYEVERIEQIGQSPESET